jgi:hypothetical protein
LENEFLLAMPDKKPVCLLCQNSIVVCKKTDLKKKLHVYAYGFFKKLSTWYKSERKRNRCDKMNLIVQKNIFRRLLTSKGCVTEASLNISWVLAKNQKPYLIKDTVYC